MSISTVRTCVYCNMIVKDASVVMARSVGTGDWICIKCFEEKMNVKT